MAPLLASDVRERPRVDVRAGKSPGLPGPLAPLVSRRQLLHHDTEDDRFPVLDFPPLLLLLSHPSVVPDRGSVQSRNGANQRRAQPPRSGLENENKGQARTTSGRGKVRYYPASLWADLGIPDPYVVVQPSAGSKVLRNTSLNDAAPSANLIRLAT